MWDLGEGYSNDWLILKGVFLEELQGKLLNTMTYSRIEVKTGTPNSVVKGIYNATVKKSSENLIGQGLFGCWWFSWMCHQRYHSSECPHPVFSCSNVLQMWELWKDQSKMMWCNASRRNLVLKFESIPPTFSFVLSYMHHVGHYYWRKEGRLQARRL